MDNYDTLSFSKHPHKAIVMIHVWRSNRESMKSIANSLQIPETEWFFPEAPYLVNGSSTIRSWSLEIEPGVYEMDKSKELIDNLFSEIIFQKYKSENVFVCGFSQGALVCYEIVLYLNQPLGGVFPIAGFFRDPQRNCPRFADAQNNTPIIIGHGKNDEIVSVSAAEFAFDQLKKQGANVELLLYNGKHKIGIKYLRKMKQVILI